jgi:hypothetical protein
MPETVFGLPTHVLVVHATVVLVPLAALVVLLHAVWPAARRRLGVVTPLLAGVALVLVPVATESGEGLEGMVGETALVERHAALAEGLLPWVVALFVVAVGVWLLGRRSGATIRLVPVLAAVAALVVVGGTVQQVVRAGHAGSQAAWQDVVDQTPVAGADRDGDED